MCQMLRIQQEAHCAFPTFLESTGQRQKEKTGSNISRTSSFSGGWGRSTKHFPAQKGWQGQLQQKYSQGCFRERESCGCPRSSASLSGLSAACRTWFYPDALKGASGACGVRMQGSGVRWTSEGPMLQRLAW